MYGIAVEPLQGGELIQAAIGNDKNRAWLWGGKSRKKDQRPTWYDMKADEIRQRAILEGWVAPQRGPTAGGHGR